MDNLKDEQNDEVEFNNFDKVFVYDLISHYFLIGAKGEGESKRNKRKYNDFRHYEIYSQFV